MFELRDGSIGTASPAGTPASVARRPGLPVDPRRLFAALTRGRRTLFVAGVLGAIAGALLAKTVVPREYTSSATIMWEPGLAPIEETRQEPRDLRTLVDSVKVPGNLAETRRRLALPTVVDDLGAKIAVASSEKSNLVTIAASWSDPETAPRIANTLVDVFLEQRLGARRQRSDELLKSLSTDADTARKSLAAARKAYDEFRAEHGIADLPIETQVAIEQAAKLRAEADAARAEAEGEEARAGSLRTAARAQPKTTVLSTTELRPQAVKLAEAEAELAGARARLSGEHPKLLALNAQTEGLREAASRPGSAVLAERVLGRNPELDSIRQILAGSEAAREGAIRRRQAYEELAAAAADRLTKLSAVEGRATELLAAVRVAEGHLDGLEKLRARAADAVRNPTTGFRVVDAAIRPERPSKSHRRLFAALAPLVSVVLAAGFLLARALRGGRVHTARELAFWGAGPVVVSSRWPGEPRALRDLTVDLWAFAVQTHGTTLVVGMGDAEQNLAEKVAACLNPPELTDDDDPAPPATGALVWEGEEHGPELRRAARLADRVVVVVKAGAHSAASIAEVHARLGRTGGVGYVLLGVGHDLAKLPDRAGDVGRFWRDGSPELTAPAYEVSHA